MTRAGPYGRAWSPSYDEEELWLALDCALWEAMRDPAHAWELAWYVVRDSRDFPDVRRAAEAFMAVLYPETEFA